MLSTLDLCFIYFDLEMKVADINFSRSAPHLKNPSHLILEVCHTHFFQDLGKPAAISVSETRLGKNVCPEAPCLFCLIRRKQRSSGDT